MKFPVAGSKKSKNIVSEEKKQQRQKQMSTQNKIVGLCIGEMSFEL